MLFLQVMRVSKKQQQQQKQKKSKLKSYILAFTCFFILYYLGKNIKR